jgi:hypothetical protein
MVPVLDSNKQPLMPCSEKRARKLMEKGEAKAYWQKGIFCIKLIKEPSNRAYQPVALGIDPGSKREGYTVLTEKNVVLNITTNTPDWVKEKMDTRRNLRRSRRYRKTPYRKCRWNRSSLRNTDRLTPSTKARWGAKLRITKQLLAILPITNINVEDIKAISKEDKATWNKSFSPLEVGKRWFYCELKLLGIDLKKTEGYDTKKHRDEREFPKGKDKLAYAWSAHNSDSHSLAELALNVLVKPFLGLHRIDFLKHYRRQLHIQQPEKNNLRRRHGTTVSMGMSKGSVVNYKGRLVYLGGASNERVSIHNILTGQRMSKHARISDIRVMYITKQRTQFISTFSKVKPVC